MDQPQSTAISITESVLPKDNFYSPTNYDFYSHQPYESLGKDVQTIRLLAVTKDDAGQLQCKLTDGMSLAEADGKYSAISYCAGDPKNTRTIQVNGLPFNAFANLAHAVKETYRYLSEKKENQGDTEILLWTDQICINQSNPSERSHQVNLMYQIYNGAREVVVCLSTDEQCGDGSVINLMKEARKHVPGTHDFWQSTYKTVNNMDQWNHWFDIIQLCEQPWWSRAWTFQEHVAARDATFLHGAQAIHRSEITAFLPVIFDDWTIVYFLIRDLQWNDARAHMERVSRVLSYVINEHQQGNLLDLLEHSRSCGASDKRDHIYAFMGLVDDSYRLEAKYDTHIKPTDVFTQTARHIIEKQGTLQTFLHVEPNIREDHSELPSWVPDWSWEIRLSAREELMKKAGKVDVDNIWPSTPPSISFYDNGKTLEVSGIYVDTVEGVQLEEPGTVRTVKGYILDANPKIENKGCQIWSLHGVDMFVLLRRKGNAFQFLNVVGRLRSTKGSFLNQDFRTAFFLSLTTQEPERIQIV